MDNQTLQEKVSLKRSYAEEGQRTEVKKKSRGKNIMGALQKSGALLVVPKKIMTCCINIKNTSPYFRQFCNFIHAAITNGLVSLLCKPLRAKQSVRFLVPGMVEVKGNKTTEKIEFLDVNTLCIFDVSHTSRKRLILNDCEMLSDGKWGEVCPKSLKLIDLYEWALLGGKRTDYDHERNTTKLLELFGRIKEVDCFHALASKNCDPETIQEERTVVCDGQSIVINSYTSLLAEENIESLPEQTSSRVDRSIVNLNDSVSTIDKKLERDSKLLEDSPSLEMKYIAEQLMPSGIENSTPRTNLSADMAIKLRRIWELRSIIEFLTQSTMAAQLEYEVLVKNLSQDISLFHKEPSSSSSPNIAPQDSRELDTFLQTYLPSDTFRLH